VYGLRREVEEKLARLPLRYFDSHAHGDLLSRVTNDIDNITTTLQQGLSQLLTSFLTVIGVLGMMLWISPLLAGISVLAIPLSLVVTELIAGRSQKQFVAQWAETGALNMPGKSGTVAPPVVTSTIPWSVVTSVLPLPRRCANLGRIPVGNW
jgi:ATP-binding cassette subfamily B protein